MDKRDQMAQLTKRQTTPALIGAWKLAAAKWADAPIGNSDAPAYLLSMTVIEYELLERGIGFCDDCSGPAPHHVPGWVCGRPAETAPVPVGA